MATRNTNIKQPVLNKPIIGGSTNAWGLLWNENIDKLSEFHTKVIADSEMQNQELARLENEKLNIEDIPSKVEPVVQEFLETTIKPEIDDYIDETSKPSLDDYVVVKKGELDQYVTNTSKPSLDTYTEEKKNELNTHTTAKKGELDTYTGTKKTQLDSYTTEKEEELDAHVVVKKGDLDSYTTTKKQEINTFTEEQKGELDTYEKSKENELNVYTGDKKRELDTYEGEKETELNQHTQTKITELSNHTNTKKGELDTYTTQKKGEITTHTDSEIERINADSELANKANKTIQVIAGNGLVGGGDLSTNRTLNIASADDGITVNADNIKLNIVDNATTDSATRAGSARQIKLLNENKVDYVNLRYSSTGSHYVKLCRIKNNKLTSYFPVSRVGLLLTGMNDYGVNGGNVPLMYFSCGIRGNDLDKPLNNKVIKCTLLSDTEMNKDDRGVYFVAKKDDNNEYIDFYIKLSNYTTNGLCISKVNTSYKYDSVETTFPNEILDYNTYKSEIESGNYVKVYPYRLVETINGTAGISSVTYIQDSGTKTQGQGYIDKSTGQVYLCLETNTDTTITDKFMSITNVELGKKIKQNTDDKVNKTDIVDNLTTADKSKVLSANMGVELNINKSDRRNRISDDVSDKSKYVKLGTIGINIGNGRNLFSCIMIGGDDFGERNSYKISLQVSGRGSTQNNVYIDAIDAINLSGISRSINGYFIAKPISSNQMEIWYRGEIYSRGFSLEAIYNNGFTINNQMSWIDDDEGTIVETGVYKIFKIKQVMHENNKLFLGNSGISSIIYIQDTGEKTAGNGYVDKTTGSLYLCKVTTTDTSVTDKFLLATNIENRDRISIIEEKLGIYHPVGKISTISVSRDENSSSPILSFSSL